MLLAGVNLNNIGLGDVSISSNVAAELASAASTLGGVVNSGDSVAVSLNKYGIVGLDNARTKYQPESLKVRGKNVGSREQYATTVMSACPRMSQSSLASRQSYALPLVFAHQYPGCHCFAGSEHVLASRAGRRVRAARRLGDRGDRAARFGASANGRLLSAAVLDMARASHVHGTRCAADAELCWTLLASPGSRGVAPMYIRLLYYRRDMSLVQCCLAW